MTNYPTVLEVMLTDVTDVVVFGNLTSTALPCAKQVNFTAHICDTVLIFEVVRGGTAVNGLQAFAALGIRVKA